MTLIELIGTSTLSLVQHTKHISANIPLHYFTKGGSGAEPPKNFWGVNKPPPLIKENFEILKNRVNNPPLIKKFFEFSLDFVRQKVIPKY